MKLQADSATRAAWVAVIAALLSVLISVASFGYSVWADRLRFREDLILNVSPVVDDYPTQLNAIPGRYLGTIATYWNVLIANNSDRDISLIKYDLREIRGGEESLGYPYLNQGLFATDLSPLDLPVNIPTGHAIRFYLKIGLLMDVEAFGIAKDFWQPGAADRFQAVVEHLISKDYDISGKMEKREIILKAYKDISARGQIFLVSFRTARQTELRATFSSTLVYLYRFPFLPR